MSLELSERTMLSFLFSTHACWFLLTIRDELREPTYSDVYWYNIYVLNVIPTYTVSCFHLEKTIHLTTLPDCVVISHVGLLIDRSDRIMILIALPTKLFIVHSTHRFQC